MIKELQPGFLNGGSGTYRDPAGYFIPDDVVEAFDSMFPVKEKLHLPEQLV